MPRSELIVLLQGARAGVLAHDGGELSLAYDPEWRAREGSYPLSLSMPLGQTRHPDAPVRAWIEGLLPDNDDTLRRWARRFGASARNPFSLLQHVGEEVAGAAQFVAPDRVKAIQREQGRVDWLDDEGVASELRRLLEQPGGPRADDALGQFSLAGAQPKTALLREGDRWGIPSGAIPTTHIFKPPTLELDHLAENEHLCLRLAQVLDISAANSELMGFDDRIAIVVERYDRSEVGGRLVRLHQEDLCQAAGVGPQTKYESEGGPGVERIATLLRENSTSAAEDIDRFVTALAFNWAIGGSDAHAKNYSVLIGPGQIRLAPLYDLISVLPYPSFGRADRIKLAMRIGGESRIGSIHPRHWRRLADEVGLDAAQVRDRAASIAEAVASSVGHVVGDAVEGGLDREFGERYEAAVHSNAVRCARALEGNG